MTHEHVYGVGCESGEHGVLWHGDDGEGRATPDVVATGAKACALRMFDPRT